MMLRSVPWAAMLWSLVTGATVVAAPATMKLACAYTPGDTVLTERVISTDLARVATENGVRVSTIHERTTNRYVYLQTYLAVWPDGRPQTIRRTYRVATITHPIDGRTVPLVVKSLQGKTVTITNRQGIAEVEAPPGLDADDVESLYQALTDDFERMVLTGERKVGDTWPAPSRVDLVIMFNATCTGSIRLDRLVQYNGMRCARITMRNRVRGVNQNGAEVTTEGPTTVHWAPSLGRALAASTRGTLRVHATTNQGADIMDVTSEGTLHVDRKMTWITVGGKRIRKGSHR